MGRHDVDGVDYQSTIYDRELSERRHIVESCPIDVYCSSINPRWGYPHKLMSYWETRTSVAETAEHVMIDSGYRRYGEINEILESVEQVDADLFIIPDITPHFYCYQDIDPKHRVKEFARHLKRVDTYRKRSTSSIDESNQALAPLHYPFEESLDAMLDPDVVAGEDNNISEGECLLEHVDGVAIGLKEMDVSERIEALGMIDRKAPVGTHVHALSPGTELEMLGFLRENPHMLDSMDISTPESAPGNNKIPDNSWTQHKADYHNTDASWFPSGTDVSTLRAMTTIRLALQLNYMLSDLCNDSEFSEIQAEAERAAPADD